MTNPDVPDQFDSLDLQLIAHLSTDARLPFSQLAGMLGVSNTLVHQRIRKLREAGLLKNAVFMVDAEILGYQTSAYCQIVLSHAGDLRPVVTALEKIPEVTECVNIAGRYDIMVRIYASNNSHLRDIVYDKIQAIDGVEGTNTVVVFETAFSRGVPIPGTG